MAKTQDNKDYFSELNSQMQDLKAEVASLQDLREEVARLKYIQDLRTEVASLRDFKESLEDHKDHVRDLKHQMFLANTMP